MKRIVILGRGGAGKSTLARQLGQITGIAAIELDKIFWQPGLLPLAPDQWTAVQEKLIAQEKDKWILDGDLGPYDAVEVRLHAADTIILLDFSLLRCAWRAFRRAPERADFWQWLFWYRRRSRPLLMRAIASHAPNANLLVLRSPRAVRRLLAEVTHTAV